MLLRRADDGRGAADGERPAVARADRSTRSTTPAPTIAPGPRRLPAAARGDRGPARRRSSRFVVHRRRRRAAAGSRSRSPASTRRCWPPRAPDYEFPDFDENTRATTLLHDRHDGAAQGRVLQPSAARAAHARRYWRPSAQPAGRAASTATTCTCRSRRCSTSTPGACPTSRRCWASSRSIRAATCRTCCVKLDRDEGVTFSHCVPTILQMLLDAPERAGRRPQRLEDGRSAARRCRRALAQAGARARHRRLRRLRHVGDLPAADRRAAQARCSMAARDEQVRHARARPACRSPLVDLRIVDAEHARRAARRQVAVGEVVVRAPWLTQGYLEQSRGLRAAVGRRLSAHQRHRQHRRRAAICRSPTASRT